MVGAMVGKQKKGEQLAEKYSERLERLKKQSGQSTLKPKVYFEEWMDPLISGIRWVSELIEIAGGKMYSGKCDTPPRQRPYFTRPYRSHFAKSGYHYWVVVRQNV